MLWLHNPNNLQNWYCLAFFNHQRYPMTGFGFFISIIVIVENIMYFMIWIFLNLLYFTSVAPIISWIISSSWYKIILKTSTKWKYSLIPQLVINYKNKHMSVLKESSKHRTVNNFLSKAALGDFWSFQKLVKYFVQIRIL